MIRGQICIDNHEPPDIARFIEPVHDADVMPLNDDGWADYMWSGEELTGESLDGSYHLERKTWMDFASNSDEIEDLLRRQRVAHPEAKHRLVIEGGGIEPLPAGVLVYQRQAGKSLMVARGIGKQPGLFKRIMGHIAEIQRYMEVYQTASTPATAMMICELYEHDQKPEADRTTFMRHFKPMNWSPNIQVTKLLGLAANDSDIGTIKAEAIIHVYGTVWAAMSASPEELASKVSWSSAGGRTERLSVNNAKKFLRSLGRLDV